MQTQPAFQVVLVEPEIPPNTGNIGRLCLAAGARLHLVQPLGFSLEDHRLRRAGLDYWDELDWRLWDSLDVLTGAASGQARFFYFTTKAAQCHWDARFARGDYLVFGRETKGLPESLLEENATRCFTIPMNVGARSLNLATAVGIVLYEALRQTRA
ncbi:MAG: tRNA (cytidine(34)-2'-O)-methyltransferase [Verrucomicrobiales bacterium]